MSGDRMQALIKAIIKDSSEENVHIKADDAVIILAIIMNRVIEDQSATIMTMLDHYREEHAVLAHQWRDDAKGSANIILNTALAAARDSMGQAMGEGANKVVALVSDSTAKAVTEQKAAGEATVKEMKRLATWMLAATGASLVTAVLLAIFL